MLSTSWLREKQHTESTTRHPMLGSSSWSAPCGRGALVVRVRAGGVQRLRRLLRQVLQQDLDEVDRADQPVQVPRRAVLRRERAVLRGGHTNWVCASAPLVSWSVRASQRAVDLLLSSRSSSRRSMRAFRQEALVVEDKTHSCASKLSAVAEGHKAGRMCGSLCAAAERSLTHMKARSTVRTVGGRTCTHWLTTSSRVGICACAFSRLLTCGMHGRRRVEIYGALSM